MLAVCKRGMTNMPSACQIYYYYFSTQLWVLNTTGLPR